MAIFLKILPCFFIAIFSAALLYAEALPLINTIEIKGLKRIDESAVKSKITQRQGEVISQEKTNDDIKTSTSWDILMMSGQRLRPSRAG